MWAETHVNAAVTGTDGLCSQGNKTAAVTSNHNTNVLTSWRILLYKHTRVRERDPHH